MRGSKNVKTKVDPVPIELPLDQKNISVKDEIMQQLRAQILIQNEDKEVESIEEFWDVGDDSDEFDPVLQSNYEIEDMQEEYLAPEAIEAAPPPERLEGASPVDASEEQDTSEPPLAAEGG